MYDDRVILVIIGIYPPTQDEFKGNRRICSQVSSICNCLCITYVEQQLDKYHLYCILLLTVLSSELNKKNVCLKIWVSIYH